jgi:hypothetical protein
MTTPFGVRNVPDLLRTASPLQFGTELANSNGNMVDSANPATQMLRPTLPASAESVLTALRGAADQTGADFDYLLNTAMRESSLNPDAKASTSSATGLFQFVEQTWLGTLQRHGADHGLAGYANAITLGKDGHYAVADKGLRQEILALRKDPKIASLMAGELTNDMRGDMEASLGRGVSPGELYVAHFLGPQAAVKMIRTAETNPATTAASLFADAAQSNTSIFYAKSGQARSVSSVLESLKARHQGTQLPPAAYAAAPSVATMVAQDALQMQPLRGSMVDAAAYAPPSAEGAVNRFGMNTLIMSPLMAQILSEQDRMASIAAVFAPDDDQDSSPNSL